MSMICPECNGIGDQVQLSQGFTTGAVDVDPMFNGPANVVGSPVICNGCNGTGIYLSFGV